MQKEAFLGAARSYHKNERLLHERINHVDQAIILYRYLCWGLVK